MKNVRNPRQKKVRAPAKRYSELERIGRQSEQRWKTIVRVTRLLNQLPIVELQAARSDPHRRRLFDQLEKATQAVRTILNEPGEYAKHNPRTQTIETP